ncbi:MAG: DUF1553 domain-containing protein [Verrucomicrobia bacterium]|nr:DUF1553 domain-containing protein [Verrucomicrobiota bacterium]
MSMDCVRCKTAHGWWLAVLVAISGQVVECAPKPEPRHWAYQKPVRPKLPAHAGAAHPIDAFIKAALAQKSLALAEPAEPGIVLRRLSLSLIGLPPTLAELNEFESAYQAEPSRAVRLAVDRLLASPHFGERWARPWLDAARYADSHGFQRDDLRDLWPFRDWVIRALNENMPFDQFTIQQIAGDLLVGKKREPRLSEDEITSLIATGFNRCTPTNVEAGSDQEEGRVNQVFDRVNTTATVWLGLTLECAQCHDHKYDPFNMRDYYNFFAFFNNTPRETELLNEKAQAALRFTGPYLQLPGKNSSADPNPESQDQQDDDPNGEQKKQGEIRHYRRTLVMQELDKPRASHVLNRGNFLEPREPVAAATPQLFSKVKEAPANRLGLAHWLVSPENPLTARVIVNRFWAELFGRGIVATPEDFGAQGDPPTHPKLLDWLAVEFVESEWDVKHILRLIVTSETFRQSARANAKAAGVDPANKLLWRYPRLRLDAEGVRDNALAITGLLSRKQFGPPVRPPQPDGLWRKVGGEAYSYQPSPGEDRYRRGIYAIRRRSALHPSFAAFDAPVRTACVVQRRLSNTPLQALALLNDPIYVEAAEAFGERLRNSEGEEMDRLRTGFRMCASRQPDSIELGALETLLRECSQAYRARGIDEPDRPAWTDVASALLNLDETICVP